MIRLSHVRDAPAATEWLRAHKQSLEMPLLVMCVTEGHGALREACREAGGAEAFFLDAVTDAGRDGPRVADPDLVLVPGADDLPSALPFLARVQESEQVLDILWVEDREEPTCEWLAVPIQRSETGPIAA